MKRRALHKQKSSKKSMLFQATIRRTTGLPMDELVETTADDPAAMYVNLSIFKTA
jgi:hypothetical protein